MKYNYFHKFIFSLFGILGIFSFPANCSNVYSQLSIPDQLHISNSLKPVSIKDVASFGIRFFKLSIPYDTVLGWHHKGAEKRRINKYYVPDVLPGMDLPERHDIIILNLQNLGYKVYPKVTKPLFYINGEIFEFKLDTFDNNAGRYCEVSFKIFWQIYDNSENKIIYTNETLGFASRDIAVSSADLLESKSMSVKLLFKDTGVNNTINQAIAISIGFFLISPGFEEAITRSIPPPPPPPPPEISETKLIDQPPQKVSEQKPIAFQTIKNNKSTKLIFNEILKAIISIKTESGHGSGFIINDDGYAITNYHVIEKSNKITAFLKGWKPIDAKLVKMDPSKDLAIIKLAGEEYDFLPLGVNSNINLGMDVYAIGAPITIGLSHSISKGILGGIRKLKELNMTLLQTDASINPGNSGGPLLNENGEVIGIVALKIAESGVEGLGFAISIDDAKRFLNLVEKR
jgi:hypothetical protein